jgi:UDP-N-acetylglucosamine 1-carboxyvinyltransferase
VDRLKIIGGVPLKGRISISGAKNAALKLMAASLLTEEPLELHNVPCLADVGTMAELLRQHGTVVEARKGGYTLTSKNITNLTAPYDLVRQMRASVVVLGPLLSRFGQAKVSLPGGCAIGTRPIDMHLHALEQMGAKIELKEGYVFAKAPKDGLHGAEIQFDKVSVGATENILMAATLAKGTTIINNAAREPEIGDLVQCLRSMGAKIEGKGTDRLIIKGVEALHGTSHAVLPDRIETGTYMAAAAVTGGDLELVGADVSQLDAVIEKFEEAGVEITSTKDGIRVRRAGKLQGIDVMTQPYPGFPTDMQAQFMAMLAIADGASLVTETIFENRFMHVPEMARMGSRVVVHGRSAMIRGVKQLTGAEVMATDLRASVGLVLCALAAKGETIINRIYHLDRGYEQLEEKLGACGAKVERIH